MSTENQSAESDVDLDTFSAEFFGKNKAAPEHASTEAKDEGETEDHDAKEEKDTHPEDSDTLDTETDEDDAEDGEGEDGNDSDPEPDKKPRRNRAQERIEELNKKYRETERLLNIALTKLEQKAEPTPATPTVVEEPVGPTPDDTNEDGSEKYPLGEFDPQYIRDLTRFTLNQEREAAKRQDAEAEAQRQQETAKTELAKSWEQKLGPAQERYPDFQERGQELVDAFQGIDVAYGDYLTTTLMSMDYGTDVLYYLACNPEEAKKIVASGAAKATVALGRLEAKFAMADEETQKARPKVSKAPEPPAHLNKGSSVAKPEVEDNTDDLDAFAQKFFKKRGS